MKNMAFSHTLLALGCLFCLSAAALVEGEASTRPGAAIDLEVTRWAAEEGQAWAQAALAAAYLTGEGVERDFVRSAAWLRLAAEQDHVIAQAALGRMYLYGLGVPQDFAQSVQWVRRAAAQGHLEAQRDLGRFYLGGTGVERDLAQAEVWMRKAAEQGDAASQLMLSTLNLPLPDAEPAPAPLLEPVH